MNLTQFKKRQLDEILVVVYIIKTKVKVEYDGRLCGKNMYTFIGINLLGRRVYLTYGINYKEDTEFWLQKLKEIQRRGVEKVLYMVTSDIGEVKRAAQITFTGIKIVETPFEAIERISKYFIDNYNNKMPEEIRGLYICKDKEEYKIKLEYFYLKYEDKKIVELLLKEKLDNIVKKYEISYNIRKMIFTYYFIRDYKKIIKREMNKEKIIVDIDEFYSRFITMIETYEKSMYMTKKEWLKIIDELSETVKEYL